MNIERSLRSSIEEPLIELTESRDVVHHIVAVRVGVYEGSVEESSWMERDSRVKKRVLRNDARYEVLGLPDFVLQ